MEYGASIMCRFNEARRSLLHCAVPLLRDTFHQFRVITFARVPEYEYVILMDKVPGYKY